jgi:hypothetical protein
VMTPDSVGIVNRLMHTNWTARQTVLSDGRKSLFEFPTRSTDTRKGFEDLNRLRGVYNASRVEIGESFDSIASADALSKIYDVLVSTCERSQSD